MLELGLCRDRAYAAVDGRDGLTKSATERRTMAEDNSKRMSITLATATIGLSVTYPDGSLVQLTMPKPSGLDDQTSAQTKATVSRLARRLLIVLAEDLA